jgi:hypothetical protein
MFLYPRQNRLMISIGIMVAAGFSAACSPSQAKLDNTATQEAYNLAAVQTAQAPTQTSLPSPTPLPTDTPIPTATQTPLPTETPKPTPTPIPDVGAILNWQEARLPPSFQSAPPSSIGVGTGDIAFSMSSGSKVYTYTIANSFFFADEETHQNVYGYTIDVSGAIDKGFYDSFLRDSDYDYGYGFEEFPVEPIGNISRGITAQTSDTRHLDIIGFRLGDVGARVFIRYDEGSKPSISIEDLAQVYAESIFHPETGCHLVSITPIEDDSGPWFNIIAEGFYPGERRMITLSGGGMMTGLAGLSEDAERVDDQGRIEADYGFPILPGFESELPMEIEVGIYGLYSGCEITEVVMWPAEEG